PALPGNRPYEANVQVPGPSPAPHRHRRRGGQDAAHLSGGTVDFLVSENRPAPALQLCPANPRWVRLLAPQQTGLSPQGSLQASSEQRRVAGATNRTNLHSLGTKDSFALISNNVRFELHHFGSGCGCGRWFFLPKIPMI